MKLIKLFVFTLLILGAWVFLRPQILQAPDNGDWLRVIRLIYMNCKIYKVSIKPEVALFNKESPGFKAVNTCEPKFLKLFGKCVTAWSIPQIRIVFARWAGYTGQEYMLAYPEIAIKWATIGIHKLLIYYHGDWSKVISYYRTGRPYFSSYYNELKKDIDKIKEVKTQTKEKEYQ